ncbi:MAG: tetratricopeptide repeat protein [Acidobacteriota bacterium]
MGHLPPPRFGGPGAPGAAHASEGDGIWGLLLFTDVTAAVQAALAYHNDLSNLPWAHDLPRLHGRVAIHSARASREHDRPAARLLERLIGLAVPDQTLVSRAIFDRARTALENGIPDTVRWLAHGSYSVDGLEGVLDVYEIGSDGRAPLSPPPDAAAGRRLPSPGGVLGWRPAVDQPIPGRPGWRLASRLGQGTFGEVWLGHDAAAPAAAPSAVEADGAVDIAASSATRVFKFSFQLDHRDTLKRELAIHHALREQLGPRRDIVAIDDAHLDLAPYYLEMTYLPGGSLLDWVNAHGGISALPQALRLDLTAQVAETLAAMHAIGVLHKDIKPSNILIATDRAGHPRIALTDFGIGAAAEYETTSTRLDLSRPRVSDSSATVIGTRLYLAPELLGGEPATVHADIYALGVILYQLLVGDFDRVLAPGWEHDIDDPLLREDLALMVDGSRRRRLGDALQVAKRLRTLDVRRAEAKAAAQQAREAEEARRLLRRSQRRRQRIRLAAIVLGGLALVLAAMVLMIRQQAERANREAANALAVSRFLVDLFQTTDPTQASGIDVSAREILRNGIEKIEQFENRPLIQARLLSAIGEVYMRLGQPAEATPLLERALDIRRSMPLVDPREMGDSFEDLAGLYRLQGRYAEASTHYARALSTLESRLGETNDEVAYCLRGYAVNEWYRGHYVQSARLFERALSIWRALYTERHPEVLASLQSLAHLNVELGNYDEAEALYLDVIAVREAMLPHDHPDLAWTFNSLGFLHWHQGRYDDAEVRLQRARVIWESALGADHPRIAWVLHHLARNRLARDDDVAAATAMMERALSLVTDRYQEGFCLIGLADLYARADRLDEAGALLTRAEMRWADALGPGHPQQPWRLRATGRLALMRGRLDDAEALYREALALADVTLGAAHPMRIGILVDLGDLAHLRVRDDEADAAYREALAIGAQTVEPTHADLRRAQRGMAILRGEIDEDTSFRPAASSSPDR